MAATQIRTERQISELLRRPGNDVCADCSSPSVRRCLPLLVALGPPAAWRSDDELTAFPLIAKSAALVLFEPRHLSLRRLRLGPPQDGLAYLTRQEPDARVRAVLLSMKLVQTASLLATCH